MIICGQPGLEFQCGEYTCILNDRFNVVLYTDHTVMRDGAFHALAFVVPTHYLSFIKTIDARHGLQTAPAEIFQFRRPGDADALARFAATQQPGAHATICDLAAPKRRGESKGGRPGRSSRRRKSIE